MENHVQQFTFCLTHQRIEDQMSPVGLVCDCCKKKIYTNPPQGNCMSFWESQPGAYSLNREPCFIYTLIWDDFRIRSLHPPEATEDSRSINKEVENMKFEGPFWLDDFFREQDNFDQES
jgi:hypothetical protein